MFKAIYALCFLSIVAIGCVQTGTPEPTPTEETQMSPLDWPSGTSKPTDENQDLNSVCSGVVCEPGFSCCETPCGGFCVPKKSDGCFHICPPGAAESDD